MLDKKTINVLKVLNKLSKDTTYKVITADEVISSLNNKSQYDFDIIKQIIEFLEKQQYINIKFSEENTYCYSLLPKARIFLEQETTKVQHKKFDFNTINYIFIMLASFIGSSLALLIFFYFTF